MIHYKKKFRVLDNEPESIVCDKCGIEVFDDNPMEIQEFHHINFVGGYGSVFGDGAWVRCDLCQSCLMELIGDYCRREEVRQ